MEYSMDSVVKFCKTKERFGGFSNMAPNYPLVVAGRNIKYAENLYQACKFPEYPEIQEQIITERNPINAKRISRSYNDLVRSDWEEIRLEIMKWVLEVKLIQNWDSFSRLLISTGNTPIVELSIRDDFWGAKPQGTLLVGENHLGRLLEDLRERVNREELRPENGVQPPKGVDNFLLINEKIGVIYPPNSNVTYVRKKRKLYLDR